MNKATVAALVLAAGSLCGARVAVASNDPAASGKLFSVDGSVLIQRSAETQKAFIGSIVGVGDSILTTDTGTAQWQMSDTSIFALATDSGFRINKYALPNAKAPEGVASYTLLQGAVHALTGTIGKEIAAASPRSVYAAAKGSFNEKNLIRTAAAPVAPYTLKTTLAVITAQSADFVAVQTDKVLKVLVNKGSVTICTIAGCETPKPGEGAVVSCDGCKPATAAGASLGLGSLVASLEFNLQVAAPLTPGAQLADPRSKPVSAWEACRTVLAHLEGQANCGRYEGSNVPPPISPN